MKQDESSMMQTGASPGRVLVVDDASAVRDVLEIKLRREGYDVLAAGTAHQAETLIEAGGVDLVLLDLGLPDENGMDLLRRLRRTRSPLDFPIVVISGMDRSREIVTALQEGANDYVTKPFDLAIVQARIRSQLAIKQMKQVNDHFLRAASHDLKKPLLLMLDVARQIRADYPPGKAMDEDGVSAMALLVQSGEFMQNIIGDLLELRAIRDGRLYLTKKLTDFGALVRQAVVRNSRYAENKGIKIGMRFEIGLSPIHIDDFRITQVLENLIGNAIKFGPRGTSVDIWSRREGDWLYCDVADTGPGIPQLEMGRLFEEYARISNAPTGGESSTGLGLSICKELVTLHDGEIGARNNPGGGATFWFRLPLV
jgi:two-component system, sensor histidine kinase and response regulator